MKTLWAFCDSWFHDIDLYSWKQVSQCICNNISFGTEINFTLKYLILIWRIQRLDKGLETWPFTLDVFVTACDIALKYNLSFLGAHGRLNLLESFWRIIGCLVFTNELWLIKNTSQGLLWSTLEVSQITRKLCSATTESLDRITENRRCTRQWWREDTRCFTWKTRMGKTTTVHRLQTITIESIYSNGVLRQQPLTHYPRHRRRLQHRGNDLFVSLTHSLYTQLLSHSCTNKNDNTLMSSNPKTKVCPRSYLY